MKMNELNILRVAIGLWQIVSAHTQEHNFLEVYPHVAYLVLEEIGVPPENQIGIIPFAFYNIPVHVIGPGQFYIEHFLGVLMLIFRPYFISCGVQCTDGDDDLQRFPALQRCPLTVSSSTSPLPFSEEENLLYPVGCSSDEDDLPYPVEVESDDASSEFVFGSSSSAYQPLFH